MTQLSSLARSISSPMMADRDTLAEAFDYAFEIAKASDNPSAVMTAIFVVTNTIAKQLKEMDNG
ncbi:MAG: hypothetical protein EBU08_04720 [Micrococcales bacterium]|nr:hypothetical protein [Micrococcales bacterium]